MDRHSPTRLRDTEQLNIACLLADGGWKYLSTQLWTTDYADLPSASGTKSGSEVLL